MLNTVFIVLLFGRELFIKCCFWDFKVYYLTFSAPSLLNCTHMNHLLNVPWTNHSILRWMHVVQSLSKWMKCYSWPTVIISAFSWFQSSLNQLPPAAFLYVQLLGLLWTCHQQVLRNPMAVHIFLEMKDPLTLWSSYGSVVSLHMLVWLKSTQTEIFALM